MQSKLPFLHVAYLYTTYLFMYFFLDYTSCFLGKKYGFGYVVLRGFRSLQPIKPVNLLVVN